VEKLEGELDQLEVELPIAKNSSLDAIFVQIVRLQLEVLQLYCSVGVQNHKELTQLFSTASGLISTIKTLNDVTDITLHAPGYLVGGLALAGFILLRMMKSRFVEVLEQHILNTGKSSYFLAIRMLKQMSLLNNDLCAKSAEFLSIMWTHQTIFKAPEPDWWILRIRNRLSVSIVFDSMLVWIEAYGCHPNLGAHLARDSEGIDPQSAEDTSHTDLGPSSLSSDDRWLYDLDWNAGLDILMAEPVGGYILNLNN